MSKFREIINGSIPVLVDFYADWCAPCKMMTPILEQLSKEMKGSVRVVKVNVDNNREAAMQYGIRNIPTILLFRNGQVKWQGAGVMQADQLKLIIQQNS
jgi:thioredoxin 1